MVTRRVVAGKSKGEGTGREPAERAITRVHNPVVVMEGGGVPVRRALPSHEVPYEEVDPFLLLDVFDASEMSSRGEGPAFPKHPHRGFEILTYLLSGATTHSGSVGDGTVVRGGGLQKITTGRGIWHGEGPDPGSHEPVRGLQLWVNLARKDKGIDPEYQVLEPEDVPVEDQNGVRVRVLAGEGSPVRLRTPAVYLDVTVSRGATLRRSVPIDLQGFVYVINGRGKFGAKGTGGEGGQLLVLGPGDAITVTAGAEPLRFMLAAARPYGEPVRWNGSFVD
jgi:redox-sensitive bicupin YhaK (pirin superfamily)